MSSSRSRSLGVDWFLPNRDGTGFQRRRFATTPLATSRSMALIADEGLTFAEAAEKYRHLPEELELLQVFIDAGHADTPMRRWVH